MIKINNYVHNYSKLVTQNSKIKVFNITTMLEKKLAASKNYDSTKSIEDVHITFLYK